MNDKNWVTPGNAIWLVIWLGATMWFLHTGLLMVGFASLVVAMAKVFTLVDEWYDVNDPLVEYKRGGVNYKPTPWNTKRVSDPSQPKPWWCE